MIRIGTAFALSVFVSLINNIKKTFKKVDMKFEYKNSGQAIIEYFILASALLLAFAGLMNMDGCDSRSSYIQAVIENHTYQTFDKLKQPIP